MGMEVALAAVAISAAAGAGTAIYSGHQQAAAAKDAAQAQSAQLAEEQRSARLAAEQEAAAKRRDVGRVLSSMDALRAGRGLDLMSGTGDAIRRVSMEAGDADVATIEANANNRTRRLGLASDAGLRRAGNQASTALVQGYGSAVGSLAGGVSSAYGIQRRAGT